MILSPFQEGLLSRSASLFLTSHHLGHIAAHLRTSLDLILYELLSPVVLLPITELQGLILVDLQVLLKEFLLFGQLRGRALLDLRDSLFHLLLSVQSLLLVGEADGDCADTPFHGPHAHIYLLREFLFLAQWIVLGNHFTLQFSEHGHFRILPISLRNKTGLHCRALCCWGET